MKPFKILSCLCIALLIGIASAKTSAQENKDYAFLNAWLEKVGQPELIDTFYFVPNFRFEKRSEKKLYTNEEIRERVLDCLKDTFPSLEKVVANDPSFNNHCFNRQHWDKEKIKVKGNLTFLKEYDYHKDPTFGSSKPYRINDTLVATSAIRCFMPTYYYVAIWYWNEDKKEVRLIKGSWLMTSSGLRFR